MKKPRRDLIESDIERMLEHIGYGDEFLSARRHSRAHSDCWLYERKNRHIMEFRGKIISFLLESESFL